jgi:hypothetical protein
MGFEAVSEGSYLRGRHVLCGPPASETGKRLHHRDTETPRKASRTAGGQEQPHRLPVGLRSQRSLATRPGRIERSVTPGRAGWSFLPAFLGLEPTFEIKDLTGCHKLDRGHREMDGRCNFWRAISFQTESALRVPRWRRRPHPAGDVTRRCAGPWCLKLIAES